jgi:hypothetical protein
MLVASVLASCQGNGPVQPTAAEAQAALVTLDRGAVEPLAVIGLTVDADGNTVIPVIADPATVLYYRRTGEPILAPDGHHVTAGEFSAVRGSISVQCVESGTQVRLHMKHLIPNATYRIWLLTFREPGFDVGPPPDFTNLTGEGSLGPNDRSRNTFRASASGEAQITRIHPEGPLSELLPSPPFANEPVGRCLLTDEFEWHAIGAFQQPGQEAGTEVGPPALFPGTAVEHFTFNVRR